MFNFTDNYFTVESSFNKYNLSKFKQIIEVFIKLN